jgi:hypothetical protein
MLAEKFVYQKARPDHSISGETDLPGWLHSSRTDAKSRNLIEAEMRVISPDVYKNEQK